MALDPQQLLYYSLSLLMISLPPLLVLAIVWSEKAAARRDWLLQKLQMRVRELETERRELEAKIAELQAQISNLELERARVAREAEEKCNERIKELTSFYEQRLKEATGVASAARVLFEAVRKGVVGVYAKHKDCERIELLTDKILCCNNDECEVLYPEERPAGEEVIVAVPAAPPSKKPREEKARR